MNVFIDRYHFDKASKVQKEWSQSLWNCNITFINYEAAKKKNCYTTKYGQKVDNIPHPTSVVPNSTQGCKKLFKDSLHLSKSCSLSLYYAFISVYKMPPVSYSLLGQKCKKSVKKRFY